MPPSYPAPSRADAIWFALILRVADPIFECDISGNWSEAREALLDLIDLVKAHYTPGLARFLRATSPKLHRTLRLIVKWSNPDVNAVLDLFQNQDPPDAFTEIDLDSDELREALLEAQTWAQVVAGVESIYGAGAVTRQNATIFAEAWGLIALGNSINEI